MKWEKKYCKSLSRKGIDIQGVKRASKTQQAHHKLEPLKKKKKKRTEDLKQHFSTNPSKAADSSHEKMPDGL